MFEVEVKPGHRIVSKTDPKGVVLSGNDKFFEYSGYPEREILGKPHSILRHHDMPKIVFKLLWAKIRHGMDVNAFVKNRRKDGGYYWVYASVTPSVNKKTGEIDGYFSIRKRANPDAVAGVIELYDELKKLEETKGYEAAKAALRSLLDDKGMKFNDLMSRIQAQGF